MSHQPTNSEIEGQEREASERCDLARSTILQCKKNRPSAALEKAITLLRDVLDKQPSPHPYRLNILKRLSMAYLTRFHHLGWNKDAEEVVECMSEVTKILRMDNSAKTDNGDSECEDNFDKLHLASSLLTEFCQSATSERSSIDTAIQIYREALEVQPPARRSLTLFGLSEALLTRFHLTNTTQGPSDDLNEAIELLQKATDLRSRLDPERFRYLLSLSMSLCLRFNQTDNQKDIRLALLRFRAAFDIDSDLYDDGSDALDRFQLSGNLSDLDTAVDLLRRSLSLRSNPHPYRDNTLHNLAVALIRRFEQNGKLSDLEEAICFGQEALDLCPTTHPERFSALSNLAAALQRRFEQKGDLADIEKAISFHEEALALRPTPGEDRSYLLTNFATALNMRFKQNGNLSDLNKSIAFDREVVDLRPAPHPNRSRSLNNLGTALRMRFEQKGHLLDLEEAIAFHREALDLCPGRHPERSRCLNNLSAALYSLFKQKGQCQLSDLDEAISFQLSALERQPAPHPTRCNSLNNLATMLSTRFDQNNHPADLEEAITFCQEAVDLTPPSHPGRPIFMNSLAMILVARFKRKKDLPDIEQAIALYHESLRLLPANHIFRFYAVNLGNALTRLDFFNQQNSHLDEAMDAYRKGTLCETAPLLEQLTSSMIWADQADTRQHASALEAFQQAVDLLPRLCSLDMNLRDRQEVLTQTRDIAAKACSWAVRTGQMEKAVEFLSAARAVFWSQALHLRTPLDELQSVSPSFAQKLRDISAELELASRRNLSPPFVGSDKAQNLEKEASRCLSLNEERTRILDKIRKLPRFNDFMLPKSFEKLQLAASKGPVVMLSGSKSGCHCLVLNGGSVRHIPVDLELEHVSALGILFHAALSGTRSANPDLVDFADSLERQMDSGDLRKGKRVPDPGLGRDDPFAFVLEVLWYFIARPVINALGLKVSDSSTTRLWWCLIGPFAFLPIHAAGIYEGEKHVCLSDYAISSYTPTLDALLDPPPSPSEEFSMVAVIEAETPGQPNLPCALKELEMIQKHIPCKWLTSIGTKETPSSVEGVSSSLANASFTHFACHGLQDVVDPLNSALFLRSGRLTMSKIMERPLPKATLAFLNACETAKGADTIPDEVMHLSASLLFAGFRGVVGTMWPIYDEDAPTVADVFYGYLFRKGESSYPDPTEAAYALHLAVKKLRVEKKVPFKRWVPFIHMGI